MMADLYAFFYWLIFLMGKLDIVPQAILIISVVFSLLLVMFLMKYVGKRSKYQKLFIVTIILLLSTDIMVLTQ